MKKNTKKSAPKNRPTKPAVLRVVSPITQPDSMIANLPVRQRDNRLPAPGGLITKNYRGKTYRSKSIGKRL